LDDSSFTLNTLERSEICQKRCFRPFCLLVLGTGAFRARWSAWHEHGAKYAGVGGLAVAAIIRPGTGGYPSSRDDDAGDVPIAQWVEPL
jgi:hypothetical protein